MTNIMGLAILCAALAICLFVMILVTCRIAGIQKDSAKLLETLKYQIERGEMVRYTEAADRLKWVTANKLLIKFIIYLVDHADNPEEVCWRLSLLSSHIAVKDINDVDNPDFRDMLMEKVGNAYKADMDMVFNRMRKAIEHTCKDNPIEYLDSLNKQYEILVAEQCRREADVMDHTVEVFEREYKVGYLQRKLEESTDRLQAYVEQLRIEAEECEKEELTHEDQPSQGDTEVEQVSVGTPSDVQGEEETEVPVQDDEGDGVPEDQSVIETKEAIIICGSKSVGPGLSPTDPIVIKPGE